MNAADYATFAMIFGELGMGKTTEAINLLPPPYGLYVGPPGAFKPATSQLELPEVPAHLRITHGEGCELATFDDVTRFLHSLDASTIAALGVHGVVIDDYSRLATSTYYAMLNATYTTAAGVVFYTYEQDPPGSGSFKRDASMRFWGDFKRAQHQLSAAARTLGLHVIATGHVRPAETTKNRVTLEMERSPTGLKLPSKTAMRDLPELADEVLYVQRTAPLDKYKPAHGWPLQYRVDSNDPDLITKSRAVGNGRWPANLRAILEGSALGYRFPRSPGLEWQSEVADGVCAEIVAGGKPEAVWVSWDRLLVGERAAHAYAALRDGVDRAAVIQQRAARRF